MIFQIGDEVMWTSQSAGVSTTKVGVIVEIVPPGIRPAIRNAGMQRDHESYIVRACVQLDGCQRMAGRKQKHRRYWPKVRYLEKT